jgi:hypothetical protein
MTKLRFLIAGMAILVSGCIGPRSQITAVKSENYRMMPHRIFIAADVSQSFGGDLGDQFEGTVEKSLTGCGLNVGFALLGRLAIEQPLPQRIQAFSPDAVLTIRPGSGSDRSLKYYIELQDMTAKSIVWKAEMDFSHGDIGMGRIGVAQFARSLVDRLKVDGIVPMNCDASGVASETGAQLSKHA